MQRICPLQNTPHDSKYTTVSVSTRQRSATGTYAHQLYCTHITEATG